MADNQATMCSARNVPGKSCEANACWRAEATCFVRQSGEIWRKLICMALTSLLAGVSASAALFEVIHHFDFEGGYNPYYGAPQVVGGKVYGMTSDGGSNNLGVIYRCDLNGENYQ